MSQSAPSRGTPVVEVHPDGFKATWPGYPKAFALFDCEAGVATITDIFRDPTQPKGSAGLLLADAFRMAGRSQPALLRAATIRMANILDTQPTIQQLANGAPPDQTVLGQTLFVLVKELGGTPAGWHHGTTRGKQWIGVVVHY